MMGTTDPLRMLQMDVSTPHLMRIAEQRRFPIRQSDNGYLLHCFLEELFGPGVVSTFSVQRELRRASTVLAYTSETLDVLRDRANTYAEPTTFQACDWKTIAVKEMPSSWTEGKRVAFETRICPIQRMNSDGKTYRRGAEVDSFLARAWQVGKGESVDRESVYVHWLEEELLRRGGIRLKHANMVRFRRTRLLRRTQGADRVSHLCERPDALMRGTLEIVDGDGFSKVLSRGLGRHRAFGFGMLLLRPVT